MSRNDIWMHVVIPGTFSSPKNTSARHVVVHASSNQAALAAFESRNGAEAEYWVSYRKLEEIERLAARHGWNIDEHIEA